MAGSIMLHWKERLSEHEIQHIHHLFEEYEDALMDDPDLLRESLLETELTPDEIEELLEYDE